MFKDYKKPLKKCCNFRTFSIFEYSVLISTFLLIMAKSMLIIGLRPHLFEEKRGNEGVS